LSSGVGDRSKEVVEGKARDGVGEDGEWDSDAFYRVSMGERAGQPVEKTRALEEEEEQEAKGKRNR